MKPIPAQYDSGEHCECGGTVTMHKPTGFAKGKLVCEDCGNWAMTSEKGKPIESLASHSVHLKRSAIKIAMACLIAARTDCRNTSGFKAEISDRHALYRWLADGMGIDIDACNVGYFDDNLCNRARKFLQERVPFLMG